MTDGWGLGSGLSEAGEDLLEEFLDRLEMQEGGEQERGRYHGGPGSGASPSRSGAGHAERNGNQNRFWSPRAHAVGQAAGDRQRWRRGYDYGLTDPFTRAQRTYWVQECLARLVGPWVPQTAVMDEATRRAI